MRTLINRLLKVFLSLLIILLVITLTFSVFYRLFPIKYYDLINKYCNQYAVSETLVLALIKAESNFDENALSTASAKGVMQLTDETFTFCMNSLGKASEKADIYDPQANINAGVWYLSFLLDKYNGNTKNAIAAYNAGASNVDKWLSSPEYSSDAVVLDNIPFGETQRYVEKITGYQKIYKLLY